MKTAEIAQRFLDYFEKNGHTIVPSASLVTDDPALLFTVAGMVPFIPYLSGDVPAPYPRAADNQKCIRTNDIEEVGKTPRHGTFFQMLGNWSFGDYFKEGAIRYAWDLLTSPEADGGLGFDQKDLWVTVYEEDDEAHDLWLKLTDLPEERIQRLGKDTNYWSTGLPGPAGPCSEIFFDRGPEYGIDGGPATDDDRYVEIWNLVFMQYEITNVRSKYDFDIVGELPNKNIDTGMGLERIAFIKQGVDNMYETDQVRPVLDKAVELSGRTSSSWFAPYVRPDSSTALSRTGRTWSVSYMLSTPCLMNAMRSRPMPVSMFFAGSSPTMSKSTFDRTLEMRSCMKTRFQISVNRLSSTAGPPSMPYSGPRSKKISEQGPAGPGRPVLQ